MRLRPAPCIPGRARVRPHRCAGPSSLCALVFVSWGGTGGTHLFGAAPDRWHRIWAVRRPTARRAAGVQHAQALVVFVASHGRFALRDESLLGVPFSQNGLLPVDLYAFTSAAALGQADETNQTAKADRYPIIQWTKEASVQPREQTRKRTARLQALSWPRRRSVSAAAAGLFRYRTQIIKQQLYTIRYTIYHILY